MWFTAGSAAETTVKVLTLQNKFHSFVNIDGIQPVLQIYNTLTIQQNDIKANMQYSKYMHYMYAIYFKYVQQKTASGKVRKLLVMNMTE